MLRNSVFIASMALTAFVVIWGVIDTQGLADFATTFVNFVFQSRGWFVMLTVSTLLLSCAYLAFSPYGAIRLGNDRDVPEFSTFSWLTMMFAAGMGVGLLFYGVAEPVEHYLVLAEHMKPGVAASSALFVTLFNWGLHAWAIYGLVGLVIAYFGFRRGLPQMLSTPFKAVFGDRGWPVTLGWLVDVLAIYAIAIGLAGSVAMGVFQVQSGFEQLFDLQKTGMALSLAIFAVLCVAYFVPLLRELGQGMALLSNAAICITIGLLLYILLTGPTGFLMSTVTNTLGVYLSNLIPHGLRTFSFWDEGVQSWYTSWTLNYMACWLPRPFRCSGSAFWGPWAFIRPTKARITRHR